MKELDTLADGPFIALTSGGREIRAIKKGNSFEIPSNGEDLFSFVRGYFCQEVIGWESETAFKDGDKVHFVNDYGVVFADVEICGLDLWKHTGELRYFFKPNDAHWYSNPAKNFSKKTIDELLAEGKILGNDGRAYYAK